MSLNLLQPTRPTTLNSFTDICRQRVTDILERTLSQAAVVPQNLHQAMRYSVLNGGKRIRPVLTYATGRALGIDLQQLDAPACAVELIHAYSLVHDDLPAMDDDDLRRGQATCHKAFDEATAILVGDALQSLAFHVLAHEQSLQCSADQRLAMIEHLSLAAGSRGMVGGQALDLAAEGHSLELAELENLHIHKTGALIRASMKLALLVKPDIHADVAKGLDHYAKCIGLAFQIQDDILDIEGNTETLGKARGQDVCREKATYPSLLGLSDAREKAQSLIQSALDALQRLDEKADLLRSIARYIIQRQY
ncbi:MAG: (2E,6E)-farnesyl diphosphate synthase [gamma proteobacterium symbiont of Bathyaustriella thionipta]|nr:(2E,6E)-farnesyl diphosphate synthase [gamma proteobacterium symbiont of Bathyaustriella thionipta]